ncbi:carboxymuconolactone decarboxylase family protein [Apibacter adventoris]|uniref:Carboxymuconolactone decarboxylase n=1 Tax=Apibacter adventoris TaxID=1679466 RepID=A0A2S8AB43_9FLAO|nr:carboxymuconolactone decarboxylase family protein [Apibacter adventoris]PQL91809.1 carboxymuconolactone decarboxylase [Apibacter adventoris]PQL93673.1 carboxymuconolactone decarboxylase [Apibacter adventoris]
METRNKNLSLQEQSIISISALTAKGNLDKLKTALNIGLEAGLTVNEIKEILVHLYAYCGFPRSIRGLQTFMEVMEERKRKGLKDKVGKEASKIDETDSKYERGKNILVKLNQMPQSDILTGYSAFAPIIDIYLKEHLFADIFERDVLNYIQRELATISVITSIGKSEPMLKSHLTICMNLGLSPEQLYEFINVIKTTLGKKEAKSAKRVLNGIRILKINQSK